MDLLSQPLPTNVWKRWTAEVAVVDAGQLDDRVTPLGVPGGRTHLVLPECLSAA
jgi:hypothetical protein